MLSCTTLTLTELQFPIEHFLCLSYYLTVHRDYFCESNCPICLLWWCSGVFTLRHNRVFDHISYKFRACKYLTDLPPIHCDLIHTVHNAGRMSSGREMAWRGRTQWTLMKKQTQTQTRRLLQQLRRYFTCPHKTITMREGQNKTTWHYAIFETLIGVLMQIKIL